MVAGKEKLYMAGVPDKYGKDEDPWKYLEGRGGGVLAVFSKESGKQLFELEVGGCTGLGRHGRRLRRAVYQLQRRHHPMLWKMSTT